MNDEKIVFSRDIAPKNDIVFKRLFGQKGNEGILKDFLESILDIKIESLELDLATEFQADFYDGKKSVVDVRTRLSDGTEINIEMQAKASDYSEKRCLYYWSKVFCNTIKKGEEYTNLRKTICIWFLNENVYKEFEEYESRWEITNKKHEEIRHFDEMEIHVIELQKFRNDATIKPSKKNFWLWFLDHTNKEMIDLAYISNERIKEAREQLEKITSDPELMNRLILEDISERDENTRIANATEKGLKEGMEKGMEKGKKEAQKDIAKKMKEEGIDLDIISKTTGLSLEEIEDLS